VRTRFSRTRKYYEYLLKYRADVIIVREGSEILVLYNYNFVKFLLTGLRRNQYSYSKANHPPFFNSIDMMPIKQITLYHHGSNMTEVSQQATDGSTLLLNLATSEFRDADASVCIQFVFTSHIY